MSPDGEGRGVRASEPEQAGAGCSHRDGGSCGGGSTENTVGGDPAAAVPEADLGGEDGDRDGNGCRRDAVLGVLEPAVASADDMGAQTVDEVIDGIGFGRWVCRAGGANATLCAHGR